MTVSGTVRHSAACPRKRGYLNSRSRCRVLVHLHGRHDDFSRRQPHRMPTIQRAHDTVAESRDARQEVAVQLDRCSRYHLANRPSGTTRPERRRVTTVSQDTRLAVELRNR